MPRKITETVEDSSDTSPKIIRKTRIVEEHPTVYLDSSDLILAKVYQVVWFILALIEILIGFRIVLKILGASSFSSFANFIYSLSYPFIAPFNGIFRAYFGPNASVIEWSSVVAGVVYAIIAWIIIYLLQVLHPAHPNHISEDEIVD